MSRKQSRILSLCLTGMLLCSAELILSAEEKSKPAAQGTKGDALEAQLMKDYRSAASRRQLEFDIAELNADQLRIEAQKYGRSAARAYQGGEYQKSIDCYLKAIDILKKLSQKTSDPKIEEKITNCRQAISNAYFYWAEKLYFDAQKSADAKQYALAIEKCEQAAKIWPPAKPKLQEAIALYKKYQKSAEYQAKVSPEAVDPGRQARLYSIDVLLKQGEIFAADKQWDKARDKYEDVLAIDPFNVKAIEAIRLLNIRLLRAGMRRTNTTRAEFIAEDIWKEVSPLTPRITASGNTVSETESPVKKTDAKNSIQSKLKSIIIPHIDFDEIELPVVLRHLRQRSKELDPEKVGVNIFLLPEENKAPAANAQKPAAQQDQKKKSDDDDEEEASSSGLKVTFIADNISLEQVLTYICRPNNLRMKIEKYAVVIAPPGVPLEQMETRIYPMEKDVIDRQISKAAEGKVDEAGGTQINAQNLFTNIPFESGAQVIYDPTISRLIVTNTADNLQKVEEMIKEMNVVDPQILIQTKFVEVQLNDLEELGFEYLFSRQNSNIDYAKKTDLVQYKSGDPLPDYTINIYQPQSSTERKTGPSANWYKYSQTYTRGKDSAGDLPSTFYYQKAPVQSKSVSFKETNVPLRTAKNIAGHDNVEDTLASFTHYNKYGYKVQATVSALDQADSTDLLACPRITTMNGYEAMIAMVTEAYYPSDWNEAEVGTLSTGAGNGSVPLITPSIPKFDDPERLGIELRVKPQVDATDNYTITLPIQPVVRSFIGWVDYSYQLTTQSNGEPMPYTNVLKMPIFENRSVDTLIQCYDGETVVLGGVMKDQSVSFDDQYPILGNLPLIGRLFQSKAKESKRTNLLIFLSCRLINPDGSPVREREMRGLPPFRQ